MFTLNLAMLRAINMTLIKGDGGIIRIRFIPVFISSSTPTFKNTQWLSTGQIKQWQSWNVKLPNFFLATEISKRWTCPRLHITEKQMRERSDMLIWKVAFLGSFPSFLELNVQLKKTRQPKHYWVVKPNNTVSLNLQLKKIKIQGKWMG